MILSEVVWSRMTRRFRAHLRLGGVAYVGPRRRSYRHALADLHVALRFYAGEIDGDGDGNE